MEQSKNSGNGQQVEVGETAPTRRAVTVTRDGLPVQGVGVRWSACCGSSMEPLVSLTDQFGLAASIFRGATTAGPVTVSATLDDLESVFQLVLVPGPPAAIVGLVPVPDSVPADSNLTFRVRVTDRYGNGISLPGLTWNITVTGSPTFINPTITNLTGEATIRAAFSGRGNTVQVSSVVSGIPPLVYSFRIY